MVSVDGENFELSLREDVYGPFWIVNKKLESKSKRSYISSLEESWSVLDGRNMGKEDGDRFWNSDSKGYNSEEDCSKIWKTLDSCGDKGKETEAVRESKIGTNPISSSFDTAVMKVNKTKGAFHEKGIVGVDSTAHPISEPITYSTKVKASLLDLSNGTYVTVFDKALEEVVNKVKVRLKKIEGKL